eukprot:TRINITY_DN11740_c1_g6_i1.p1 TRINITY_DN11740_c1_g6~~TRINITY_DN11740_c1_g6_i1.p1  ORF type:complete len:521 (+),score=72.23 TRINITY_DN11740_c1_g6_i1:68-1564(+)
MCFQGLQSLRISLKRAASAAEEVTSKENDKDVLGDDVSDGVEAQSPLSRWYGEPVTFELVGQEDGPISWQSVPARTPKMDAVQMGYAPAVTHGQGVFMIPMAIQAVPFSTLSGVMAPLSTTKPSCSASTLALSSASSSDDSSECVEDKSPIVAPSQSPELETTMKLSTSASRRRRRQKAAAHAAVREDGCDGKFANNGDNDAGRISALGGPNVHLQNRSSRVDIKERVAQASFSPQRCADLAAQLSRGGTSMTKALQTIRGSVRWLSVDAAGCRLVQDALQAADQSQAIAMAEELRGSVWETVVSPHGNYVVQKVIEVLPNSVLSFIGEELKSHAVETARHRYGCRVLSRLLEQAGSAPSTVALVDAVLIQVGDLCTHNYGHHVIESVVEHGQPNQKSFIVRTLCSKSSRYSIDRNGTHVLKAVLISGSLADKQLLIDELTRHTERLLTMAENPYGHHVVRAMLKVPLEASHKTRSTLSGFAVRLRSSPFGSRVVDDL